MCLNEPMVMGFKSHTVRGFRGEKEICLQMQSRSDLLYGDVHCRWVSALRRRSLHVVQSQPGLHETLPREKKKSKH